MGRDVFGRGIVGRTRLQEPPVRRTATAGGCGGQVHVEVVELERLQGVVGQPAECGGDLGIGQPGKSREIFLDFRLVWRYSSQCIVLGPAIPVVWVAGLFCTLLDAEGQPHKVRLADAAGKGPPIGLGGIVRNFPLLVVILQQPIPRGAVQIELETDFPGDAVVARAG